MTWNSNIVNRFLTAADKYPGRNAITETTGNITYGKLKERVSEYAGYLKASGIQTGDRVLVFLPISIELYVTVLAIFQIGAVAVFLDPWSGWKRLKASAELADCKALVAGWKIRLLMRFMPVFRSIHLKLGPGRKESPLRDTCFCEPDDQALITFTTGSSGTPKAANRTHGFLQSQLNALEDEVPFWEDDVLLTNLPVFVLVGLARGTTVVLPDYNARKPTNMKPEKVQKQITEASVRTLITSPDFAGRLAEEGPYTVQRLFTGGAPVFPPLAQKLGKAFKEAKIIVAYGSTEAEPISSLTAEELLEEQLISGGLPAGKPYSKCEVKIIGWRDETLQPDREAFQDLCLPEGSIGEIIVSGPHILREYFRNFTAQQRYKFSVDQKLWHRTGDSGFIRNGKLYLTGPCQQLIPASEGWLSGFILENKLMHLPNVEEGTLIHISGKKVIFAVPRKGTKKERVKDDIHKAAIHHDHLILLKALPKDPRHNSKIEYGQLRRKYKRYYSS